MNSQLLMAEGKALTSPLEKRARKRFCWREAAVDGKTVRFELRADGLHVRRKRSRKVRVITFADAWLVSQGQGLLKL